jgi:UDP-glucose:(heptosyl)LPS alpha-1,3-glucosyltransferase
VKVALVAHHARPTGGQDRYLLELARHLGDRHDVHLVVVRAEGTEGMGVTVHELGLKDRPVLALSPRFAHRAAALVSGAGYDIVHGVGGSLPGANVITAQYCHAAWHEARRRYRVPEGTTLDAWYQTLVGAQAVAYERRAYADPALRAVIAVSRTTAGELTRYYRVGADRITVVHNGADPEVFDRARYPTSRQALRHELGIAADAPVALLVGTYARKGLDTAIAAVARASSTLHLVVAGAGDRDVARRWAASAGLAGRLHLLGARSDVASLYAAADVFILPTRYEPFGMVIAEAMASSLPVIVSACSGAAELIEPGVSGYVVEAADDADAFAAHLRTLLADPAHRETVGRAARQAAQAVAWPTVAAQTEAVYHAALARS